MVRHPVSPFASSRNGKPHDGRMCLMAPNSAAATLESECGSMGEAHGESMLALPGVAARKHLF